MELLLKKDESKMIHIDGKKSKLVVKCENKRTRIKVTLSDISGVTSGRIFNDFKEFNIKNKISISFLANQDTFIYYQLI